MGLTFGQSLREVLLPQAFRGAVVTPLGNTLIALTKNTTVATAIGVAEIAGLQRTMLEDRIDLFGPIIVIVAHRLRHHHAADGPAHQLPVLTPGGEAMSDSVLFDSPGPKARARYRTRSRRSAPSLVLAFLGVRAVQAAAPPGSWRPTSGSRSSAYRSTRSTPTSGSTTCSPGLVNTLKAAAISIVLALVFGFLFGDGPDVTGRGHPLVLHRRRRAVPLHPGAGDDARRLLLLRLLQHLRRPT